VVLVQEALDLAREGQLLGGKLEVHGISSTVRESYTIRSVL
jgi:hypothetical protein